MLSLSLADGDADGDAAFFNTSYPLVDGFLAAAAEKTGRGVVYSCSWPAYTASGHGLPIQYDPWHDRSGAPVSARCIPLQLYWSAAAICACRCA